MARAELDARPGTSQTPHGPSPRCPEAPEEERGAIPTLENLRVW